MNKIYKIFFYVVMAVIIAVLSVWLPPKAIKYALRTGQWEEYKLVTYESENEPGVEIIFVVLRRINESNIESS